MPIANVLKSIIVMNSFDTRLFRNVFEAVQKTRSTCFTGLKPDENTAARVLNITQTQTPSIAECCESNVWVRFRL